MTAFDTGGARAAARCNTLAVAPYSDMANGLYRAYLTPAHRAAIDRVSGWMVEAGMTVALDGAANLVGHYAGSTAGSAALIIGSHLDSVRDGGPYDGPLGVLLGIECVAVLAAQGRRLPFAIDVYAFGDEEGSRFPAAMLSSRAVAGALDPATLAIADADGVTLASALAGFDRSVASFGDARREAGSVLAYLETHIEQGPLLEAEGLAVGSVTGIAAQLRYRVAVRGVAGHAGTSSMGLRNDALTGACEMILAVEAAARADASDLVATVGQLTASPGAPNVIPGLVEFSIDVRSGDPANRDRAAKAMLFQIAAIAEARGLSITTEQMHELPASPCDPALVDVLDAAIADAGQPPRRLVSGAGHDAMVMAALCPTALLFVRCRGGISHNPAEHVEAADADVALQVMLGFIDRLGARRA